MIQQLYHRDSTSTPSVMMYLTQGTKRAAILSFFIIVSSHLANPLRIAEDLFESTFQ